MPTAESSTWPACAWPGSAGACVTATGPTSTPTGSRPGAPGRCAAGRGGAGSGTAAGPTGCPPTRRHAASATVTTRRTAGSGRSPAWSPRSSPRCCCMVTSIPTARPSGGIGCAAPASATAPDGTCAGSSQASACLNCSRVVAVPADTGSPRADVENDFERARRRQTLARLAHWLRREPDDVNLILPFDEVVAALGMRGERRLGLQNIRLDSIVGTLDSGRDFDRRFRPTSGRVRERWERLALAQRRGESIPPIDVYRIGDLHFVQDGHHRVSIAIATGAKTIEAYVTEILTAVPARGIRRRGDLLYKSYERLFRSRVKLPEQAYATITFSDPWSYAELGEAVEAWGCRYMQDEHRFMDRDEIARRWFAEEYRPVVRMLRAADMIGSRTEAEAYMRVAAERYRLIRTHEWNDEIIERLRRKVR